MNNFVTSQIRTYVPIAVGSVFSWLLLNYGLNLDREIVTQVSALLTAGIIALYYLLARTLERRWPQVGKWLLGSGQQPVYKNPETTSGKVLD